MDRIAQMITSGREDWVTRLRQIDTREVLKCHCYAFIQSMIIKIVPDKKILSSPKPCPCLDDLNGKCLKMPSF